MEKLLLVLLISFVCLCNARLTLYSSSGFLSTASEESDDSSEEPVMQCGEIASADSTQFKIQKRITKGGIDAKYLEFPWLIAMFAPRPTRHNCALLDKEHDKVKVRAGDWNLDTSEEQFPHQERYVAQHIIHERFEGSNAGYDLKYDAALLILESPFTSADNIGIICLPPANHYVATVSCKAAGWGVMNFREYGYRKLLQVVDVNYVDHNQCERSLKKLWQSSAVLHDTFTCAGGVPTKGVCQGDGGTPLMCRAEDHYYARGLSSWVVGCGTSNIPDMYTDVVKIRSWIDEKMKANGFSTDTYTHVAYKK